MDKTNKILNKMCKIVKVLKEQSDSLVKIQKQTGSVDMDYVTVQEDIKNVAEKVIRIMKKILKES